MKIEYRDEIPDADLFFLLYRTTEWDNKKKKQEQQLHEAIKSSWYMVSAYFQNQLIGCGRIISDGYLHAFITEMIIHPHYQRQGIGKEILNKLIWKCHNAGIMDIQLFCAKGKKEFYLKNGFDERPNDAPGMQIRDISQYTVIANPEESEQ
jgi:N-acetylglutamate synthase-like GNAT family acetyltransferase